MIRQPKHIREFNRILKRNGYDLARVNGSHFIYVNRITHRIMPVNKDLNEMVRLRLIKQYDLR